MIPDATAVVEVLVRAGFDPADAHARVALYSDAASALRRAAGAPEWAWFVPGRIEVIGKHTDYAGGRSLVAAAPRGFVVVARARRDDVVRVIDAKLGESAEIHASSGRAGAGSGWRHYVAVAVRRLAADFPGARFGTDIGFASDLPRAAGLSSSSALMISVATALATRAALKTRDDWQQAIRTPLEHAAYLAAVESGAGFGPFAGTAGVGTHGGSEDHTAILNCRANTLSAFRYAPTVHLENAALPAAWRLVIGGSGVTAEKTGAARDRYNLASRRVAELLARWNSVRGVVAPTLAEALRSDSEALEILRGSLADRRDAPLADRLTHFVNEDARVPLTLDAIATSDQTALGELAAASQLDAERLLGNQVDETRQMVAIARDVGAFAASSFGAGFGGSVWAMVRESDSIPFARAWLAAYRRDCPHAGLIESFATRGSPGLLQLPVC